MVHALVHIFVNYLPIIHHHYSEIGYLQNVGNIFVFLKTVTQRLRVLIASLIDRAIAAHMHGQIGQTLLNSIHLFMISLWLFENNSLRGLPMWTIALILVVFSIAGCATSYEPEGFGGGFSETQLEPNLFKVNFRGNGWTRTDRAEDLALLRSAELTLANGFTHFIVIDNKTNVEHKTFTTPVQSYTTANATAYGNSAYGMANTTTYGGQTISSSRPTATYTVMCFKGKPDDAQGIVYDAQFLCGSLGKKYDVVCKRN